MRYAMKAKKQTTYHHGDLRKSLISHALAIVNEEGIARLTLRKVARQAGVSHAAPAHHFKDMQGLLAAIAEEGFEKMERQMIAAVDGIPGEKSLERFKTLGKAYIRFAVRNPADLRIMFHPRLVDKQPYPGLERAATSAFSLLTAAIRDCQEKKQVRAGDIRLLSLFAWSTVHGLSILALDNQLVSTGLNEKLDDYTEDLIDLLISGMV